MGNTSSDNIGESNEEDASEPANSSYQLEAAGTTDLRTLDFGVLLDPKQLRELGAEIKEETAVSPLQQHHYALVRWLENGRSMEEEFVTLSQFTDFFSGRGVERAVAKELFQQFDVEGDGICDVDQLHQILSSGCISNIVAFRNDLPSVNKLLRDCVLVPGFVDGFNDINNAENDHGQKLFKFLFRNQALSVALPLASLEGFITTTEIRLKLLAAYIQAASDASLESATEANLQADEVVKPIPDCITSIDVSTNRSDTAKLRDGDAATFWQSDGPARGHWIRLHIIPNTIIKQLSLTVVSTDQSYMPQNVVVSAGRDAASLRDVANVKIPSHFTGDYTVLENMSTAYAIIQINIKRCHSDGCDTRVHQVKAIGFRVIKSKGVSVMDASMAWYLSVLTSTAEAALPTAPQLCGIIMRHTRESLKCISPLALSSGSSERPKFLSGSVMMQMEHFLHSMARNGGHVEADDMSTLIEFSVARGSVGSIVDALSLLCGSEGTSYPVGPLLQSLKSMKDKSRKLHGNKLAVNLYTCDGGAKDSSSMAANVLTPNWDIEHYLSASGKKMVTMSFRLCSLETIELTRVIMKVAKGPSGPGCGLVFVMQSSSYSSEDEFKDYMMQALSKYDTWRVQDYEAFLKSPAHATCSPPDDFPVAFFWLDNEWDDIDVFVDKRKTGDAVVIKFLGSRQESAERIGICGIDLLGYEQSLLCKQLEEALEGRQQEPRGDGEWVAKSDVFFSVMDFLRTMAQDMVNIRASNPKHSAPYEEDKVLDVQDVTLGQLWTLYSIVDQGALCSNDQLLAKGLILDVFSQALQFLNPDLQKAHFTKNALQPPSEKDVQALSKTVFMSLCEMVNQLPAEDIIHQLAKDIILAGAEVFFPESEVRREFLLELVKQVLENNQQASLSLTFESLCSFFSSKDAKGLLGLPSTLPKDGFKPESVVGILETLLCVAHKECLLQMRKKELPQSTKPSSLVQLVCALQKTLLTWCYCHCQDDSSAAKCIATNILCEYLTVIAEKSLGIFRVLLNADNKLPLVDYLECSFVSVALRPLVLFLNLFAKLDALSLQPLYGLKDIAKVLCDISGHVPEQLSRGIDGQWANENSVIFKTWDVESTHPYESNSNIHMVFDCQECISFRIEFDERCSTERRYDYLDFVDSGGGKRRCDDKVGTEKWPKIVEFPAGKTLSFHFHSDGSDNQWGYKFKVTAVGTPDIAVMWVFDLQLNLARMFGSFCSHVIDIARAVDSRVRVAGSGAHVSADGKASDAANALLHSELWASLFRGGYLVGKLERSLSGYHGCSPSESQVSAFLNKVARADGIGQQFIERCQKAATSTPPIGGVLIGSAVSAVFAALVWHTQELRDQIASFASFTLPEEPSAEIIGAYKTADAIRQTLLKGRQHLLVTAEKCTAEGRLPPDPDTPAVSCREKALFLLKFAGLSRLSKSKLETSPPERRSSFLNRPKSWHRQDSKDWTRQQHHWLDMAWSDKYPTFKLVIEFVLNSSLSHEKIHSLLQQRRNYAQSLANALSFAADFLQMQPTSNFFTAPVALFLQQLLCCQRRFPHHYADYLNGCGLELESRVRRTCYRFIRLLMETEARAAREAHVSEVASLGDCARIFLLHFLTIAWKPYDHAFLSEIGLPKFLLHTANSTALYPKARTFEMEMEIYDVHLRFFKEAKSAGINSWCQMNRDNATKDQQRFISLFIARFSDQLDVTISCDGCKALLKHRRYRCLNCVDTDMCSMCYSNGIIPDGHADDHQVIDLRFKCDFCNAFIIGTRIHCNTCKDFDLCFGCYHNFMKCSFDTTPKRDNRHQKHHSISKFHFDLDLQASRQAGFSLHSYVHHYSWLQFAALTLTLSNMLQNRRVEDSEYTKVTSALLLDCMRGLTRSLSVHASTTEQTSHHSSGSTQAFQPVPKALSGCESSGSSTVLPSASGQKDGLSETEFSHASPLGEPIENGYIDSSSDVNDKSTSSVDEVNGVSSSALYSASKLQEEGEEDDRSDVTQERILGLLAAILPRGRQLAYIPCADELMAIIADELLPALLAMLVGKCHSEHILCLALGAINKTFKCIGPKAADRGTRGFLMSTHEGGAKSETSGHGFSTVDFLYKFGISCLINGRLNCVACAIRTIGDLLLCRRWRDVTFHYVSVSLSSVCLKSETPTASELFALAVQAGFPDVCYIGKRGHVIGRSDIGKQVALLHTLPDHSLVSAVDLVSRKRMMVKEHCLEFPDDTIGSFDAQQLPLLIGIINNSADGSTLEEAFLLALALKAFLRHIKNGASVNDMILCSGVVPRLVALACRGTSMDRSWMLKDLEFLGWTLYRDKSADVASSTAVDPVTVETGDGDPAGPNDAGNGDGSKADPLHGLRPDVKQCMLAMHKASGCSLAVIRAIYESNDRDCLVVAREVHTRYTVGRATVSDELRKLAELWGESSSDCHDKGGDLDCSVDLGVDMNSSSCFASVQLGDLQAKPEADENQRKLIASVSEIEVSETRQRQRLQKSADLFSAEMEKKNRSHAHQFAHQVHAAVAVGYTRRLLACLFASWPTECKLSNEVLHNIDARQIIGLLDLLQELDGASDQFNKVVFNFVRSCDRDLIQPLALSAVQCMSEVRFASEQRESEHNYKCNTTLESKVHIPGATSLFVCFDARCSTELSCDELALSSSPNFQQNRHAYSGPSDWLDIQIPGDTLYYKFTSDSTNCDWGWKFTVTGGQLGRFETGCAVLSALLGQDLDFSRMLPLRSLWAWLVVVACNQVGQQRLMATGLLLRILQIAVGDPFLFGAGTSPLPTEQRPDLNLLKPLWSLYTKTMEDDAGTSFSLVAPVTRGLSELFLVVENVAQDWDATEDLVVGLTHREKLAACFAKAIKQIAAISLAVGLDTKAVELLKRIPMTTEDTAKTTTDGKVERNRFHIGGARNRAMLSTLLRDEMAAFFDANGSAAGGAALPAGNYYDDMSPAAFDITSDTASSFDDDDNMIIDFTEDDDDDSSSSSSDDSDDTSGDEDALL